MRPDELPCSEQVVLQNTLLQGEHIVWLARPQRRGWRFLHRFLAPRLYVLTNLRALVLHGKSCLCYPRTPDMIYDLVYHEDGTVSLALGPDWELSSGKKIARRGFMHLSADAWNEAYNLMKQSTASDTLSM